MTLGLRNVLSVFGGLLKATLNSQELKSFYALSPDTEDSWEYMGELENGGAQPVVVPYTGKSVIGHSNSSWLIKKGSDDYELIWKNNLLGILKLKNQVDYCQLGCVLSRGMGSPDFQSFLFQSAKKGALVNPIGYAKRFELNGLAIWDLIPPEGYVCLGAIATEGLEPVLSDYCCPSLKIVSSADLTLYNEIGGTKVWKITKKSYDLYGIVTHMFLIGNVKPKQAFVLSAEGGRVSETKPFRLHKIYEFEHIWDEMGSGSPNEVSVWSGKLDFNPSLKLLGQNAVPSRARPEFAYALEIINPDDAIDPIDFSIVWSDHGSGAVYDLTIWKPICPVGTYPTSHTSTKSSTIRPEFDSVCCLKNHFFELRDESAWETIWDSEGTGSFDDVTLYKTVKETTNGVGMLTMFAIENSNQFPGQPMLLNKAYFDFAF